MAESDTTLPADDYSARLRKAIDPATPAADLADLAYQHAELRPLIAANPNTYEGLLEWLGGLNDPAITAAIAGRGEAPVAPTAPVAKSTSYLATVSQAEPVVTTSAASQSVGPAAGATAVTASRAPRRTLGAVLGLRAAPDADPAAAATRKRRSLAIMGGSVAALLVVVGGAVAANLLLSGGGSSATASAVAFPASTFSWTEVAIDPSINQKLAAAQILENMSTIRDFVDDEGPDIDYEQPDLKQSLWDYLFDNRDFDRKSSLDYEDIQPWLGSRIAVGYVGSAPTFDASLLVAIEASDPAKGVDAVVTTIEDLDIDGLQVSSRNGYVLVSDVDFDIASAYDDGTLAGVPAFAHASGKLGSWGLGAFWTSPRAAVAANLAWSTSQSERDGELSLVYWEDRYKDLVDEWQASVAQYSVDCPSSATFLTEYCIYTYPETESDFYDYNDFYPTEWKDAAAERFAGATDELSRIVDTAETLIDTVSADGSISGVVRLTGDSVELVIMTTDLRLPDFENPQHASALANLPASTIAAASVSQVGSILDTAFSPAYYAVGFAMGSTSTSGYSSLYSFGSLITYEGIRFPDFIDDARDDFENSIDDRYGLNFPDDVSDAFGTNAIAAIDGDFSCGVYDFTYSDGDCSDPNAGILIYSEDVGNTSRALDDVVDNLDESYDSGIDISRGDGRVAVARGGCGEVLPVGDGELGKDPTFAEVLPDLGGAFSAGYVDVQASVKEIRSQSEYYDADGDGWDFFDGIRAAGYTASNAGNGDITVKIRILTGKE